MNLEEFIKDVLISLDKSVETARSKMKRDINFASTENQRTLEFDIAVSVEEASSKAGKAGVKVLQFAEGGGSISKENKNSTVSRVKFGINIDARTKEEQTRLDAAVSAHNAGQRNKYGV